MAGSSRDSSIARLSCLAGPVAVVFAWIIIGLSWWLNRNWFIFTRDAYSDFGSNESCCPGLYNYGLIITGLVVMVYGSCIAWLAQNKLETGGGFYMFLAGIFLALIGVYPSGTRPHVFVSTWFFIQADLALILTTAGLYARRKTPENGALLTGMVMAFPIALLIEALIGWPSAATIETFGILVIDAGVLWTTKAYL